MRIPHVFQKDFDGLEHIQHKPHLVQTRAELPALYQQCDNCVQFAKERPSHPNPTRVTMLYRSTRKLHQELQAWKQKWDLMRQDVPREVSLLMDLKGAYPSALTVNTQIDNVETAIILSMYDSAIILLANIPTALLRSGFQEMPSCSPSTLDSYISSGAKQCQSLDVQGSVISICFNTEYLLRFLQAEQAPADFYLFFPLHVAHRAATQLEYCSEMAWLSNVLEKTKNKYPMGVWANMDCEDRFNGLGDGMFG